MVYLSELLCISIHVDIWQKLSVQHVESDFNLQTVDFIQCNIK